MRWCLYLPTLRRREVRMLLNLCSCLLSVDVAPQPTTIGFVSPFVATHVLRHPKFGHCSRTVTEKAMFHHIYFL